MNAIGASSPEIEDTDVRERMHDVIYRAFVLRDAAYAIPPDFGMFSEPANTAVRAALVNFLGDAGPLADEAGLTDPAARLKAFQDIRIVTGDGQTFDTYFGERPDL